MRAHAFNDEADVDTDQQPDGRHIGRIAGGFLAATIAAALIVSSVAAASPGKQHRKLSDQRQFGCNGIANAYSQVSANAPDRNGRQAALDALSVVAAKKGCDLSGVEPAAHPNDGGDAEHPDSSKGPPAEVSARKCARISEKLAVAQDRPHGHSADAFARQADKWSCPLN